MADRKKALITGITGQDGSYLAELLLEKGYDVYGLVRRTSYDPEQRLADLIGSKAVRGIKLVDGSVRDLNAMMRVMDSVVPDEVYSLAAQSHVGVSFKVPEETWDTNYYGVARVVIEAMRVNPKVRIYQASTSEMFGNIPPRQNETSGFAPVSPYAEAKLRAHEDFIAGYRERHGLFAVSGILFNHESPRRGRQFVTRKVTHALARIKLGLQDTLELGNLDTKRDWGYAKDYVEAMWQMLQLPKPEDFVIASGRSHTVRDFVNAAAHALDMPLTWEGAGEAEVAKDTSGAVIVKVNPEFYRPTDPHYLEGDTAKAEKLLGWKPKTSFEELVAIMAAADLKEAEIEKMRQGA